ncbi:MAG: MBL fold metallo-hydrolase [Actinomycetota bacterium]|nr:MBL fold metallo-hydrolase [Actinomycetota bacterium]
MKTVFEGDGFSVRRIVTPPFDNNVYLITCTETRKSLIVDAASDPDAVVAMASGTAVIGVATTHGHWDHHGAIPEVTDRLGIPFFLHTEDAAIADKEPYVPLTPGALVIGDVTATVLHTPGHTPGSVCIALPGVVLSGDTLFPGGPGATRFDHSSFDAIIESITANLFTRPPDTVVLPGHGSSTTIATEQPHLATWIERGW